MATAARVKYPAALQRCKFDTPLLAAGSLISVLSNDISVIESDYLRAGFDFAALITTFTISSIALFTYSIAHGALILGTSIFLVAISYLLKDKVGSKRLVVSACNEHYISKVKDMFYGGLVIRQFLAISRMSNEHDEVNKELEKSKQRFLLFTSSVNIHESKRIFI